MPLRSYLKTAIALFVFNFLYFKTLDAQSKADSTIKINPSDIGITYIAPENADSFTISVIDGVLNNVITVYNSENHAFKIHRKTDNESMVMSINFKKFKFLSNGRMALGYVTTTALMPVCLLFALTGHITAMSAFLPNDKFKYKWNTNPEIVPDNFNNWFSHHIIFRRIALFSNRVKRMEKIKEQLTISIKNNLNTVEHKIVRNTKGVQK